MSPLTTSDPAAADAALEKKTEIVITPDGEAQPPEATSHLDWELVWKNGSGKKVHIVFTGGSPHDEDKHTLLANETKVKKAKNKGTFPYTILLDGGPSKDPTIIIIP